jgi:DNA polymerase/3'-5' exonuclease PolX
MAKAKIPLADAERHAADLVGLLESACERIAVAGSIRRRKPEVGDIEIVAIPSMGFDLFGDPSGSLLDPRLERLARDGVLEPIRGGNYYKQFAVPAAGCKLDLFLCNRDTWGMIFTVRTGSAQFSHRLVTPRGVMTSDGQPGMLPPRMKVRDARIWEGDRALETPEEEDVFRVVGLGWIEPEGRR